MVLHTDSSPAAIGPYSQAHKVGQFIFTSGQLGIDMKTGKLADGVQNQTRCSLQNISMILKEAGADCGNIIKTTVFVKDLADFKAVNEVYATFFDGDYPARSCVQVAALPMNGLVEIEAVAIL